MPREDRGRGFREERITKGGGQGKERKREEERLERRMEGGKKRFKRTINLKPRRKLFELV